MKRIILFVEDECIQVLNQFKKDIGNPTMSDEKAFKMISLFIAEQITKGESKIVTLFDN